MADEKEDLNASKQLLSTLKDQAGSGNHIGVLQTVAKSPPNCKDADLQKQIAVPVVAALSKLKKSNIDSVLNQADERGREVILGYVFYGFHSMPKASTELLNWHQAIVAKDGIGAIVRVSTNIKRNILVSSEAVES